jgi:hypothetical protein
MAFYTRRAAQETAKTAKGTTELAEKTQGMAVATEEMARQTKIAAEAGVTEATATVRLAEEARLDRELSWSPYLVRTGTNETDRWVGIENVGRGPALRCFYFACDPHKVSTWWYVKLPAIQSGGSVNERFGATDGGSSPLYLLNIMPADSGMIEEPLSAFFCEDIVGNRLRFLVDRPGRDIWRPGDKLTPQWASTPLLWGYPSWQQR